MNTWKRTLLSLVVLAIATLSGSATAQIDPLRDYTVYTFEQNGAVVGRVLVTGSAGGGFDAHREYWYLTGNLSTDAPLKVVSRRAQLWNQAPTNLGKLSFVTRQQPEWTATKKPTKVLMAKGAQANEYVGLEWKITKRDGKWTGQINWYHTSTGLIWGENQSNLLEPGNFPATEHCYRYVSRPL